ncbi:hypothetical protein V6N13_060129 [Hibiscus sabdariffa]
MEVQPPTGREQRRTTAPWSIGYFRGLLGRNLSEKVREKKETRRLTALAHWNGPRNDTDSGRYRVLHRGVWESFSRNWNEREREGGESLQMTVSARRLSHWNGGVWRLRHWRRMENLSE